MRMLKEFKATLEADKKLSSQSFYITPQPDKPPSATWPNAGGRKFRHFYIVREDGTNHLASVINVAQANIDMTAGGRPYTPFLRKGYDEVSGERLDKIVEEQQSACIAVLDAAVDAENKAKAIPVATTEIHRGRRRHAG